MQKTLIGGIAALLLAWSASTTLAAPSSSAQTASVVPAASYHSVVRKKRNLGKQRVTNCRLVRVGRKKWIYSCS